MIKVALTGGLASGKSSVCQILKACGAYVVSADEIVHQLLTPSSTIGNQVIELLGTEILTREQIDRKKIAKKVFSQPTLLEQLEKILHPAVLNEIEKRYNQSRKQEKYFLFVAEIPLLYESESHKFFDLVVAVVADENLAKKRFTQVTGHPESEYEMRMKRQMKPELKAAEADIVITNNGSLEDLEKQVLKLYQNLRKGK